MDTVLPIDLSQIENIADVPVRYEPVSPAGIVDTLVDTEVMSGYTFQYVNAWTQQLKLAGDIVEAGRNSKGLYKLTPEGAAAARGYTCPDDSSRAIHDIVTTATLGWDQSSQTHHPLAAPRFPHMYTDRTAEVATEDESLTYLGALLADRLGRLSALEVLKSASDIGDWIDHPLMREAYIQAFELDHVSALFDQASLLGSAPQIRVLINADNVYGRPTSKDRHVVKTLDLASIEASRVAVSMLQRAFEMYDTMTDHYGAGSDLERWERPIDMPEIALAREYVFAAGRMSGSISGYFQRYAQKAKGLSFGQRERQLNEVALRHRDRSGDTLAGLQYIHEEAVFKLSVKFGERVEYINRTIGGVPTNQKGQQQHARQYARAYEELGCISNILQAAICSGTLPVNTLLRQEVRDIIERVQKYSVPQPSPPPHIVYRYSSMKFEGYDAACEKRFYRTYPQDRDTVTRANILI